jgi:hypothetical protein
VGDVDFVRNVYDVNDKARHTQFADYHGHGWNFRAILKRDREGNLLDADGNMATYGTEKANMVSPTDPDRWRKPCAMLTDPKQRAACEVDRRERQGSQVRAGRPQSRQDRPHDGHPCRKRACSARTATSARTAMATASSMVKVANAIEIGCKDCHGTAKEYPNLPDLRPGRAP